MAFENWPYSNFHDLNLDWILCRMKELHQYVHDNIDAIPEIQQEITDLDRQVKELQQLWSDDSANGIMNKIIEVIGEVIKQVFFGLTESGYFVAYIPDSWNDITFNTTLYDYDDPTNVGYGHLVLSY